MFFAKSQAQEPITNVLGAIVLYSNEPLLIRCHLFSFPSTQIIIPYRGDHYDVLRLKLVGDLGQVLFLPYHLCDEDAIRKAVKHSNIVINLVGRDWETRNFSYDQVSPRRLLVDRQESLLLDHGSGVM